jgi:hypothetical protein
MVELRRLFVVVCVACLFFGFFLFVDWWTVDVPPVDVPVVVEDNPLWDCRTMGNRVCELYERRD